MNTFHIMKFIIGLHKRGTVVSAVVWVEGACSARFEEGVVRFVLSSHCVCARVRLCAPPVGSACVRRLTRGVFEPFGSIVILLLPAQIPIRYMTPLPKRVKLRDDTVQPR